MRDLFVWTDSGPILTAPHRSQQILRFSDELSFVGSKGRLADMARWYEGFIEEDIKRAAAAAREVAAAGSGSGGNGTVLGGGGGGGSGSGGSVGSGGSGVAAGGAGGGPGAGASPGEAEDKARQAKDLLDTARVSAPILASRYNASENESLAFWEQAAAGLLGGPAGNGSSSAGGEEDESSQQQQQQQQPRGEQGSSVGSGEAASAPKSRLLSEGWNPPDALRPLLLWAARNPPPWASQGAGSSATPAGSAANPAQGNASQSAPGGASGSSLAGEGGTAAAEGLQAEGAGASGASALAVSLLAMRVAGGAPWPSADNITQFTEELGGADVGAAARAVEARLAVLCTLWEPLVPTHWMWAMHIAGALRVLCCACHAPGEPAGVYMLWKEAGR
jgi:hypothetical protein